MIGFWGANCILLALALAAIAIGRDQFFLNRVGHSFIIAGMTSGLIFTIGENYCPKHLSISILLDKMNLFYRKSPRPPFQGGVSDSEFRQMEQSEIPP